MNLLLSGILCSILVVSVESEDGFEADAEELEGIEGIELDALESGESEIRGEIHRASDLKRIQEFLRRRPEIKNRAKIDPDLGLSKQSPILSGAASLAIEVSFAEIKKSAIRQLGLRLSGTQTFGSSLGFKFAPQQSFEGNFGTLDPIRTFLDLATQSGDAKIFARETLIVHSGKQGFIHAGGEFPIKSHSAHSSKVDYKPYGFSLRFLPTLLPRERVHLSIHSNLSDIDMGSQVDGLPMMIKKEISTSLDLRLNQMTAIAGVSRILNSRFSDEMPGIGSLPFLGRLFRSEDFKNQESEAYFFAVVRRQDGPWQPNSTP